MSLIENIAINLMDMLPFAIVRENEGGVFLRCGKYKRTLDPGMYWTWPFIDEVQVLDITTQVINLPNQSVGKMAISGAIEYFVENPRKALLEVQNFDVSLQNLAMAAIADCITKNQDSLAEDVYDLLDKRVDKYGLAITNFWITDLAEHKVYRIMSHDTPIVIDEE